MDEEKNNTRGLYFSMTKLGGDESSATISTLLVSTTTELFYASKRLNINRHDLKSYKIQKIYAYGKY